LLWLALGQETKNEVSLARRVGVGVGTLGLGVCGIVGHALFGLLAHIAIVRAHIVANGSADLIAFHRRIPRVLPHPTIIATVHSALVHTFAIHAGHRRFGQTVGDGIRIARLVSTTDADSDETE
jgi:hypothetical protein